MQEKLSLKLVRDYEVIGIEDLDIKNISKLLRNAKNINDTSWSNFTSLLERKAVKYDCIVMKADRWFPSSQICSKCGYRNKDLKLNQRVWTCPECGASHVRDVNAAVNLRDNALSTLGSRGIQVCGDSEPLVCKDQAQSTKQKGLEAIQAKNGNHLQ